MPTSSQPKTVRRLFPEFNGIDIIEFCAKQLNKLKYWCKNVKGSFHNPLIPNSNRSLQIEIIFLTS